MYLGSHGRGGGGFVCPGVPKLGSQRGGSIISEGLLRSFKALAVTILQSMMCVLISKTVELVWKCTFPVSLHSAIAVVPGDVPYHLVMLL